MNQELDIFNLTLGELEEIVLSLNEKKFRAKQVYEWLHSHVITSYDDMRNVPKSLRSSLENKFPLELLKQENLRVSIDGTKKYLFRLKDNKFIETVLIPNTDERLTACLSSQVGCVMQCDYCATGKQGFDRNLSSQEICFQVAHLIQNLNKRIDNIVMMGQGEPFLNYENVVKAIKRLNHDDEFKIASRKITVSTCGVTEGIKKFSHEPEQFGLAVSLHSANQDTRNVLMPKTKNMPLESLSNVLKEYQQISNRRITFEYMLLEGINDSEEQCNKLIEFCKPLLSHVNLLHYNKVDGSLYKSSSKKIFEQFEKNLTNAGIACSVRKSMGDDIQGACGQLASDNKNIMSL